MEDSKSLAGMGYADPVFFCRFFLENLFPDEIPWVHRGILAILTRRHEFLFRYGELDKIRQNFVHETDNGPVSIFNEDMTMNLGKYTVLMLPRGMAKTTIAGIAAPLWDILYMERQFQAYVSHAAPHAKMQLTNIKRELTDNKRILATFGNIRPEATDDQKWSEDFFETTSGCAMVAKGQGGQIRGLNHRGVRPQKIVCDDLEDLESVSTEEQREKVRRWAYADLIPALPELDPSATIVVLGTLLHADSLLQTFARDPIFTLVKFGALDRSGDPIWAKNLDHEKLAAKKRSYALIGQLHTFYMEYHNEARSPETQIFKPEYIKHEPLPDKEGFHFATYIDPAISEKRGADSTVIATVGMHSSGRIWVVDMWGRVGASERDKVDEFFRQAIAWKSSKMGVESIAYQAVLVHLLREEMFRKHFYFEIESVTHKVRKVERIKGILQPRYASGYIRHARRFPEYEAQLLDFPNGTHDDYPDAVAGAVALLDPYAAAAAEDRDLTSDEYEPLEDWRWA